MRSHAHLTVFQAVKTGVLIFAGQSLELVQGDPGIIRVIVKKRDIKITGFGTAGAYQIELFVPVIDQDIENNINLSLATRAIDRNEQITRLP